MAESSAPPLVLDFFTFFSTVLEVTAVVDLRLTPLGPAAVWALAVVLEVIWTAARRLEDLVAGIWGALKGIKR